MGIFYMLNVAHVKSDVKWLPICHQIWLIENMSRTGLHDCLFFIDDFKRNSNFGIGVLHVKVKYWRIFVTSFLCSLEFLLIHRNWENLSEKTNWKFYMAQVLWYDCTFIKQNTVPVTLTFDLWGYFFLVNWVLPYKYLVYISDRYLF